MPTYEDYMFAQRHYQETEACKVPGQKFCDKYGWRLGNAFNTIQRPDNIQFINGTTYRTHTPTYHVWYQSNKTPSHHVWIEFSGPLICVKSGINVYVREGGGASWGKRILEPDPNNWRDYRTFSDGISAVEYILSTNR